MPYPQIFYVTEKSSESSYSYMPPGFLDVGRLVNSQPHWKKTCPLEMLKPKSLVLADWSAVFWSDKKIGKIRKKIEQLINEGFSVSLWQNGTIKALSKETLYSLYNKEVREKVTPSFSSQIKETTVKFQKLESIDTVHVLDDHGLRCLLEELEPLEGRSLDIADFVAVKEEQREFILSILEKEKPQLTHVIRSEFSKDANEWHEKLKKIVPELEIFINYRKLKLDNKNLEDLRQSNYRTFIVNGQTVDFSQFQTIEDLDLDQTDITDSDLHNILEKLPILKRLRLSNCDKWFDASIEKNYNLPSLEQLDLSDVYFASVDNLRKLLPNLTGIKELDLSFYFIVDQPIDDEWNWLSLEKLTLRGSGLKWPRLAKLLVNTPSLRELSLRGCLNLDDLNLNTELYFPSLEKLDVSNSRLLSCDLQKLLANMPLLKELNLDGCWGLENLDVEALNIPFLEQVIIRDRYSHNKIVQKLLDKNPHLRIVRIKDYVGSSPNGEDPIHCPSDHLDHKPTDEEHFNFKYKGLNKTLNQGMIIEQLSQYLTLTQKHAGLIPKIQDGICVALTHYFIDVHTNDASEDAWNNILKNIREWDGHKDTLGNELGVIFDTLITYLYGYQFQQKQQNTYLGDNLLTFLDRHVNNSFVLHNPWHAIAISSTGKRDYWTVYDPNFVGGKKQVTREELGSYLKNSLGDLISVKGEYQQKPGIQDPQSFLRDGGLLALCQATNDEAMLSLLPKPECFLKTSLDGLLIRSTNGEPAWSRALRVPRLGAYTVKLLRQFAALNADYISQIGRSLDALSSFERQVCIESLIENGFSLGQTENTPQQEQHDSFMKEFTNTLHSHNGKDYDQPLQTWKKAVPENVSLLSYCQRLVSPGLEKKQLVELNSKQSVQAFQLNILKHCTSRSRPVYVVNSPEDLVCSAPFIEQNRDGTGTLKKGPGGSLFEFLKSHQNKDNPPVLLVNYDNFKADDIVRYNALLDKERMVDGTPLSKDAIVIGFINSEKPDCYQGEDFYSRFGPNGVERCPFSEQELKAALPKLPSLNHTADCEVINLCKTNDWKERLLGRWTIKKNKLYFEEGELVNALQAGKKKIHIQNGLWDNERFQTFWQQAVTLGRIVHEGRVIEIPKEVVWSKSEGYDWKTLTFGISFHNQLAPFNENTFILNPTKLGEFFKRYECDNDNRALDTIPGILEQHKNKTITVNLTRSLSEDQWGLLLLECKKNNVLLNCHLAAGVHLPPSLKQQIHLEKQPDSQKKIWDKTMTSNPLILTSGDVAATVVMITSSGEDWDNIDISECDASHLLSFIDGKLNENTMSFIFQEKLGVVLKKLQEGKKIVLHGHFSDELIDSLAPLLLSPLNSGQLVLVSSTQKTFNYYPVHHHEVSSNEKLELLEQIFKCTREERTYITRHHLHQQEPYSRLCSRLRYIRSQGHKITELSKEFSDNAWQGMKELPTHYDFSSFNEEKSEQLTNAFSLNRLQQVETILQQSPYVFLSGPTGVGKTTFVTEYLKTDDKRVLYQGESSIGAWAKDVTDKEKILFIDEANITKRQWSEFEGLFHSPLSIFIDGTYYPLSEKHKVVFAGNPLNYGGERQLPSLFSNHGNAVVFEPMPLEFIYKKLLKPVFDGTEFVQTMPKMIMPILDVYQFICQHSQNEILISPRELQMMGLLALTSAKKLQSTPHECALAVRHYAYQLGKNLVPESYRFAFEQKFLPQEPLKRQPITAIGAKDEFLITSSRQLITQQLDDLLTLNHFRSKMTTETSNDIQRYGGLGGIVLEGEPGIGKSELVINILRSQGYKEEHDYQSQRQSTGTKSFYRMPVSMQLDDKKKLLLKAFHEGAIVIIDEINSSPMMERLLNNLLMGTDHEGNRPKQPGFMVIGTQNPITFSGRRKPSMAFARRIITMTLPPYTEEEMKSILLAKGVSENDVNLMISSYEKNRKKAQREHLTPAPTFRDLLTLAEQVLAGNKKTAQQLAEEQSKQEEQPVSNIFHQEFILAISVLQQKMKEFENNPNFETNPKLKQAYKAANKLYKKLEKEGNSFFTKNADQQDYMNFKSRCKNYINNARVVLDEHRGWTKILINVFAIIITAAIGYVIALGVNLALNKGRCTFFATDSSEKLDEITDYIESKMGKAALGA